MPHRTNPPRNPYTAPRTRPPKRVAHPRIFCRCCRREH